MADRAHHRRIVDRSVQLLALAAALYVLTYAGYRLSTGVRERDPLAAVAAEAQALLDALPADHAARAELVDLQRQAADLARGVVPVAIATPGRRGVKTEEKPNANAADAAKAAAAATSPADLLAERKTAVAAGLMRIIDRLEDSVEQDDEQIHELERRIAAGEAAQPAAAPPHADVAAATGESPAPAGASEPPLADQLARAKTARATAIAILPRARPLRRLALWLSDEKRWTHERHAWATFWAMAGAAIPTGVSFVLLLRGRKLRLIVASDARLPAASVRRREQERDLRQSAMASYFMHALMVILPALTWAHAYRLGPPGGGGGQPGAQQAQPEQVKVVKVQRRKLILNPYSSVLIDAPKELDLQLDEATRRMAVAATGGKAGGEGAGDGSGYEGGGKGGRIQFVVINHGGDQWDQVMPVSAPAFLREFSARVGVATEPRPIAVRIADLAAQRNPAEQPPLIYLCIDGSGYRFGPEDIRFLQKYVRDYGGMILIDDISGALPHAQNLARQVLPGQPMVPIPKDDLLFRIRVPMAEEERALAKHGGDHILGVKVDGRWALVYHPGDLVDGWRKAYGVKWQEGAFAFGINCWDYAAKQFTRRLRAPKPQP